MQKAGLYIHIPFCEKKCEYCDFYSITRLDEMDAFVQAVVREMELRAPEVANLKFETVFLGGGTPSLLNEQQIRYLWGNIQRLFQIDPEGEFTLEANPGTLDRNKLGFLYDLGITRLSLGVQSFNPSELKFLGRIHSVQEVFDTFELARKIGFRNINLDLMTAFPGITPQSFAHSLQQALALSPEHISCYTLIFEPGTPFYKKMQAGILHLYPEEKEAAFYEQARQILEPAGYIQYEISNFAKGDQHRCRHNLIYWQHDPYLGLGPSAHSFLNNQRWANFRSLNKYINQLKNDQLPVDFQESLSNEDLIFEHIFLRLRLREGIELTDFRERFGLDFVSEFQEQIRQLSQENLIKSDRNRVYLTETGMMLADSIATYF